MPCRRLTTRWSRPGQPGLGFSAILALAGRAAHLEAVTQPSHRGEPVVEPIQFDQVETQEQKEKAAALIREYLKWLNDRLTRDYGMEFDVETMGQSDISDPHKFHPPHGRSRDWLSPA